MACIFDEEVDWSDGSLDPGPSRLDPIVVSRSSPQPDHEDDNLFVPETTDWNHLPSRPLSPSAFEIAQPRMPSYPRSDDGLFIPESLAFPSDHSEARQAPSSPSHSVSQVGSSEAIQAPLSALSLDLPSTSLISRENIELLIAATTDRHATPARSPSPISFETGQYDTAVPSRAQRAQLSIHLNRREPSKDDYANFTLYQANQKVYEVTVLKIFAAQALHPDTVAHCFDDDALNPGQSERLTAYMRAVLQNLNGMIDKITFNAHHRAANLLANAGRDGVAFIDSHSLNRRMFSDFRPDNPVVLTHRLNASWHRIQSPNPNPAMVRMSTKQFPIGASSSPIEEIDETAALFAASSALPSGRAKTQASSSRKRRLPSQATRDERPQRNWLAFPNHFEARQAASSPIDPVGPVHPSEAVQPPSSPIDPVSQVCPSEAIQDPLPRADSPVAMGWGKRAFLFHQKQLAARRLPQKLPRAVVRMCTLPPRKKRKATSSLDTTASAPLGPHPSGSTTLDLHQILPPDAYFEPREPDERPAWRCGIHHAMGQYYNAGNRKGCPGCFTNVKSCAKTKQMDFYLPPSTYFFQPVPNNVYKPSKLFVKVRRSDHLSHNSIAKEAYWAAIEAGASPDDARQAGVQAVERVLLRRAPKEPSPEPTPEPEPDLGPHPSGSATMEHGQQLPQAAYMEKTERHEEFAWRCDLNHALGRYYLAGDKRSCPGCGSNRNSESKKAVMDFYLPFGAVVRQEAPGLSNWKPRKPNQTTRKSSAKAVKYLTHNQKCSRKYFEAVERGLEHDEAVSHAIRDLEEELAEEMMSEEEKVVVVEPEATRGSRKRSLVESESGVEDIREDVSPVQTEVEEVADGGTSSSDDDVTSGSDSE